MGFGKLKEMKSGGGHIIKLEDGKDITGVFCGEPVTFFAYFNEKEKRSTMKTEPFMMEGKEAKERFRANFVTKGPDGKLVAKVFEGSAAMGRKLADLEAEYDFPNTWFKIKRQGSGKNTEYNVMYREPVTESQRKLVDAVELHKFAANGEIVAADPATDDFPESMSQLKGEDIPI